MRIGASQIRWFSARFCLALALSCLVSPALWAQEKGWENHMKAGSKASMSFRFAKAEKEFQAALAETQTFPPTDLRTAETLSKLANLYTKEQRFTEAENRQKQAVAIFEASVKPDPLLLPRMSKDR